MICSIFLNLKNIIPSFFAICLCTVLSFSQQAMKFDAPSLLNLQIDASGNLKLNGHCFSNLTLEDLLVYKPYVTWCWSGPFVPPTSLFLMSPDFIVTSPGEWTWHGPTLPVLTANRIYLLDGNLWIQGSLFTNSSSLPGTIRYRNSAGTPVASFTSNGDLYLSGNIINTGTCAATQFEKQKWNDAGNAQGGNNCYNYANDQMTYTFAQAGKASGHLAIPPLDTLMVKNAAINDGLKWVGKNFPGNDYDCAKVGLPGGHLVFFALTPDGGDYHFFRLDQASGTWSHKPDWEEARDYDYSNNVIVNPLTANKDPYTQDGGFMCSCGKNAFVR